jgi:hypothetical protein
MNDYQRATLSSDTSLEAEQLQVRGLRQMPSWRKLALVGEMNQTVRTLARAGLRQRYPAETPAMRRHCLADLLHGPELAARAYGSFQEGDGC